MRSRDTETAAEKSAPPSSQVTSSDQSPSSQDQGDREEDPGLEVSDDMLGALPKQSRDHPEWICRILPPREGGASPST